VSTDCPKCGRKYGAIEGHYCTTGPVPNPGKCCGAPNGDNETHYCHKYGAIR